MPCFPRTLPCTGDRRSSCSAVGVFPSAGRCPGEVPVPLRCTSPWDDRQGTSSGSTPTCLDHTGMPAPQARPSQGRCSGRLFLRFVLVPCGKGNQKIFLSKAKKARIVRQGHFSLYYTYRMGIHTVLTRCMDTHFFLFSLLSLNGTRKAVKGSDGKNRTAKLLRIFFRTEPAKPLTASQCEVTFADRKKKNYPISSFTICFTTFIFTLDASALS